MKAYLITLFVFCLSMQTHSQVFKDLYLQGELGLNLRVVDGLEPVFPQAWELFSSPIIGIELGHRKLPVSAFFRKNVLLQLLPFNDFERMPIHQYFEENHFGFAYNFFTFKSRLNTRTELSYFHYRELNVVDFAFPFFATEYSHGLAFYYGVKLDSWLDIGYKRNAEIISRGGNIRGHYLNSIHFGYRFGGKKSEKQLGPKSKTSSSSLKITALLGMRTFPITYKKIPKYHFNWLGISGQVGLEFLVPKYKMSLNLERDWWIRFTGGNPERSIQSYISTSVVGLKYHQQLKNGNFIKYGIGGCVIQDHLQRRGVRERITNKEEDIGLWYYNVKGMAVSVAFPIHKNFDIDLRQAIAFKGEKAFRVMRLSVGGVYRFRPN